MSLKYEPAPEPLHVSVEWFAPELRILVEEQRVARGPSEEARAARGAEREFFIDNLLIQIHFIIVMIR